MCIYLYYLCLSAGRKQEDLQLKKKLHPFETNPWYTVCEILSIQLFY